ncbi:MAG: multidrug DMT transporter permease [Acidobacteria bacterium]|nr:MAG: multidrug DMT transporter permease [Acidobacteriota bacterium]
MFMVDSYPIAVLLCFCAMVCWGSWQNAQVLAGKTWRFELFYWDYAAGILVMSLVAAFTIGSLGTEGRTFLDDLAQAEPWYASMAVLGGVIWNLGTLSLVAAISLAGMAIAFTFGGGLAWVLGIWVQYADQPKGNPVLLGVGSVTIVIAVLLSMTAFRRLSRQQRKNTTKGIVLSVLVGVMISVYYLFVQRSIDPDFLPASAGRLTNYTAVVFFSLGVFLSTFLYNSYFMKRPVEGEPLGGRDYLKGTNRQHLAGLIGGMIWCCGNILTFMAVRAAGPAISYGLSIAAPVVAAIWGVFVWKEFKDAPAGTNSILAAMFGFYLVSLVLITAARF